MSIRSRPWGSLFQTCLVAVVIGAGAFFDLSASKGPAPPEAVTAAASEPREPAPSPEVLRLAHWSVDATDNAGMPFLVVDKSHARLHAFDAQGRLAASAPVLLGASRSDDPLAPATPAGRFVADAWLSARSDGIVWVKGSTELSLHAVPSPAGPGRSLQRLASARVEDKRISEGSLHVAAAFYDAHLSALRSQPSVVYVLPETSTVEQVFGFHALGDWPLIANSSPRPPAARSPS